MEYARHKPEPTQPGNPHKLTKNQHVFPFVSIRRFEQSHAGVTAVLLREKTRLSNLRADNKLFCANRVWDQRAESGYMAQIEREFQFVANRLIASDYSWLNLKQSAITAFYALWELRAHYRRNPEPAVSVEGVHSRNLLTKDTKEFLEAHHTAYIDENHLLPSRQLTGMRIQFSIDSIVMSLAEVNWRPCWATPDAGEFLVPDRPVGLHIPITPTLTLLGRSDIDVARPGVLRAINLHALAGSDRFVFARNLGRCRLVDDTAQLCAPFALRTVLNLFPDDVQASERNSGRGASRIRGTCESH